MIEKLIATLEKYGVKLYRQGSMTPDEQYPDTFLTYWNADTSILKYYDNKPIRIAWTFWIYCYSISYQNVLSLLDQIRTDLKAQGYLIDSLGYDVNSDVPTHSGRMISVIYLQDKGGLKNE